jgi:squalene-hopene/tetraprenyl-beta-curcumene cyclase
MAAKAAGSAISNNGANNEAIQLASSWLLGEADRQFAETQHKMRFSRAAGFSAASECQSSDIFARATLGNLFVDIASFGQRYEWTSAFLAIARHEAEYVAQSKVSSRLGGWSYFPGLPELPPDADSLAAALSLFVRIAPHNIALCREAVELVLAAMHPDGSFETWIVAPTDTPMDRAKMQWAIQNYWGTGTDVDVLAHFYHALWLWDPRKYRKLIAQGIRKLIEMQQPDGSWRATWYAGSAYGTGLALRLLRETDSEEPARKRGRRFLLATQNIDGTWGDDQTRSLETALSVNALLEEDSIQSREAIKCGCRALRIGQLADGSWHASPWIKMEIGRATGSVTHLATYQSTTISTAFCLRALLLDRTAIS